MSTDETRPEGATSEPGGPATDPGPTAEPAPAAAEPKPYPQSGFFASIRRGLFPRSDQRWVGGVAGGLAERIGWDPLLVRGLLIVSFFLGGLGLILYGIGWALLPERDGRIHLQEAARGNFDVAMLGAVAVFLTGFTWAGPMGWWNGGGGDWFGFVFWLAVLGAVFYLIVQGVQRHRDNGSPRRASTAPAGPGGPVPFVPAPPVDYRRSESQATAPPGAGPAPYETAPYHQAQSSYRPGPPQPAYTTPPRPSRAHRGPGGTIVGITLGVIMLSGALLLAAHRLYGEGYLPGTTEFFTAWLGIGTVALGIAILTSGMRGRTSGVLGFLAIVAMLFGLTYIAVAGTAGSRWVDEAVTSSSEIEAIVTEQENPDAATITEGTVTVQTAREAEDGFYVRWGDPVIDLSELDLSETEPGDPVVVPIQLGAGQTVVKVPRDVPVEANAYVAAGAVQWNVDDQDRTASGVSSDYYFASDEVGDDGAVLSLEIVAGAGEVVVSETK